MEDPACKCLGECLFDQRTDPVDSAGLRTFFHGFDIFTAMFPEVGDGLGKCLLIHFCFFKDHGKALAFKGSGIKDLVPAAGLCRERDQERGLSQGKELADGVGAGPGNDDIAQGEEIRKLLLDILILYITFEIPEAFVQFSFAAQMDHLPVFQELRQGFPDGLIDGSSSEAAAHDHEDRFVRQKAGEGQSSRSFALCQFPAYGTAGQDCFFGGEMLATSHFSASGEAMWMVPSSSTSTWAPDSATIF